MYRLPRLWTSVFGSVCAALLLAWLAHTPIASARPNTLPPDFVDELVTGVSEPTALAFTPDGRLLIASKSGQLRVFLNGTLTTVLNLASPTIRICDGGERGLLGIAVDPNFNSNNYIYLFYTARKFNSCSTNTPSTDPVNRVSRFTLSNSNVVTNETIILDNMPSSNSNHNGGDVHFGADGLLYVSIGDGGCKYNGGGASCQNANDNARTLNLLSGKILRVNADGTIPASNPYTSTANSRRCALSAPDPNGGPCQETFAWGLRNPFRIAFRPSSNQFYINDVGGGAREEIDNGQIGADYGWNCREGTRTNSSTGACNPTPSNMIDPLYEYDHGNGCYSITGGAFVPSGIWPAAYDGAYLFGDYGCGKIFQLVSQGGGGYTTNEFATSAAGITVMRFGPYGVTQALYYGHIDYGTSTYEVRRIRYVGVGNNIVPNAILTATPTSGIAPLTVTFNASGSSDANNDPITYTFSFGDGNFISNTASAIVTHTYTQAGIYTASLTVRDALSASTPANQRIDVGNTAPIPIINAPLPSARFRVGQIITLTGSATDAQDGALPDNALSWRVLLYHVSQANPGDAHAHPYFGPASGNNLSFTAPAPEDLDAAALSYLEIQLTATDSNGLPTTITRTLQPNRTNVMFATQPNALRLLVNGATITATKVLSSWEGYLLSATALSPQTDSAGVSWRFNDWSDGGAASHIITSPATSAAYTATFIQVPTAILNASPLFGLLPVTVTFDASGSTPSAGGSLTYTFDFGDGTSVNNTSNPTVTHIYTQVGLFTTTLTVLDSNNLTNTATVVIDAGNIPPTPTINLPLTSTQFAVGQIITLNGSADDLQDGPLPDAALSWRVILHGIHASTPAQNYQQTIFTASSGNNLTFTAPAPAGFAFAANSYLEIQLTAADSHNLKATITRTLQPQRVPLTFATQPTNLSFIINSAPYTGAQTLTSWANYPFTVSTPNLQRDNSGQTWIFNTWSDGGAQTHVITTTASLTYTATFTRARNTFLPLVFR